jgi:hypothetical protein
MNLIKLQDYMNRLPPTPQTLQYLQAAANGQNPQIPPWVALTRMNEVQKALAQQAGQGEGEGPPSGTIKDKIAQASGVLATQQNQQQAAAQQMQAQQVRQGAQMPPQGGVQQLPPQPPAGVASIAPRMAYGGGIRGYAGGGGIASVHRFAEGGSPSGMVIDPYVWEYLKRQEEEKRAAAKQEEEDRKALLAAAQAKIPVPRDPNEIAMEEYRRMGVADPAAAYNVQDTRIAELQKRMAADEAKRTQEQDTSGRRGFYQSLIDAGEATRGRTGFSGLAAAVGGYGTAQNAADAAAAKDRRESEATLMRRQAELNELMSGVTAGRMGTAEKFATRGTGYADKRAEIEAAQQAREADARRALYTGSSTALRNADKDMTPIVGRMVGMERPSAGGANADAKLQLQELRLALQATQNNIKILQDDEKTAQKPGSYPTVQKQTEAIQAIRARRAAEEKRMADIQREIDKLSGPSTSAPTPTSGATPSSGTAPSPASSAQKFREQFPRTR